MPKDARVAVPRWRWIGAAGLVALVVAAGVAWFLTKEHAKSAQAAAAATVPAPAVGVRPVVTKGVSQSFEFVGRIKAIDKVELRARVEGFLEKVLFREGQDVKTGDLLYQIEKVQFQARSIRPRQISPSAEAEADQRPAAIRPQPRAGEAPVQSAEPGRPGQGGARHRRGQGPADCRRR